VGGGEARHVERRHRHPHVCRGNAS
jgi:hypothetical protein